MWLGARDLFRRRILINNYLKKNAAIFLVVNCTVIRRWYVVNWGLRNNNKIIKPNV